MRNMPLPWSLGTSKSLFGAVITTGKLLFPIIPATDPRRCGLPKGHPPAERIPGAAVLQRKELNRDGGNREPSKTVTTKGLLSVSSLS